MGRPVRLRPGLGYFSRPPGLALHSCADTGSDFPSLSLAGCTQLLDESQVTLSFQDWLASVTERIHQTMHYQFEGKALGTTSGEPLGTTPLHSLRYLCR